MLVAVSIMVLVLGITVPIFMSSRGNTRRAHAVNAVKAVLSAARQAAVRGRTSVAVEFVITGADTGDYMIIHDKTLGIADSARQIGRRHELPDFIRFEDIPPAAAIVNYWSLENGWDDDPADDKDPAAAPPPYPDIVYKADGTLGDAPGTTDIVLLDTTEGVRTVLRVLPTTGLVIKARHRLDLTQTVSALNPERKGWL